MGNANSGNHNAKAPTSGTPDNLKEQMGVQKEIKDTLNRINELRDAAVDKKSAAAKAIKQSLRKGETWYKRKHRVDAMFSASVSNEDIYEFVQALVQRAKSGDISAITVLLDRLIGKPLSAVDLTSGGEPLDTKIELVLDVSRGPQMQEIAEGDATRVESLSSPSSSAATEPTADGAVEAPRSNIV